MELIPNRPIVLGATYGANAGAESLLLINTETRKSAPLPVTIPAKAIRKYSRCPGPLNLAKFSPHGIFLKTGAKGRHELYVVNHSERESVEVFSVDARKDISARWLGCVVLPEGASGNAVAPLADGGFLVTKFFDTRKGPQRPQFASRDKGASALYRWSPRTGFSVIPGGNLVGANGLIVSPDGASVYLTSWVERRIVRLPLAGSTGEVPNAPVDFMPDNLHWASDGSILIAGQIQTIESAMLCKHKRCPQDWSIARLDPKTMAVSYLYWEKGTPEFSAATTALQVGDKLWIGTFLGDRIVIADIPAKPL
jgi:hypothetical protein